MKKTLAGLIFAFALFVPGVFLTACTPAKVVSFEVELANNEYEFVQNQVVVEWGSKVEISPADFVVTATLDNDKTKVLSEKSAIKDGYTFSSDIPDHTITPLGEYTITFKYGNLAPYELTLVVEKANIDMSGVNWNYTQPFTYDGTEKTVAVTGLPNGVSVTYEGVASATNVGTYEAIAVFAVEDPAHYNAVANKTLPWKIEKATLDVSGLTWNYTEDFVYDGQPKSVAISGTLPTGFAIYYTGTTSATEVGEYTAIANITTPSADLYNEVDEITLNWKIVKADLAPVLSIGEIEKVYAGEDITITKEMITGLPANYAVKEISGDFTARNVGTYNITISFEYTGEDAENYNEIPNLDWTWEITKAPLTLTALDSTTTYGLEATNNGFSGNFVGSDDKTILKGEAQYVYNYELGDNAGKYTITLSGLTADNYEITFEQGELIVEKAPLIIKPRNPMIHYGEALGIITYDAIGLVCGDEPLDLGGSLEKHYEYQPGDLPGKYPLTLSGKTSNNYEITFQPGEITVQRAILYATIGNVEVEIGKDPIAPTVTLRGFVLNESESDFSTDPNVFTFDYNGYDKTTAQIGDTFTIKASCDENASSKYWIMWASQTPGTLTVIPVKLPQELQEAVDALALTNNVFDYVEGIQPTLGIDENTISQNLTVGTITVKEGEAILPGTYTAVIPLTHPDYTIQPIERTFTINKVEIDPSDINTLNTLTLTQSTFVYDGTEKTVTLSNLPTWAKVSESTYASGTVVGSWGARFVIAVSDENFYVAFEPVSITLTWNISPAELTITVNDNTITYGEDPANAGFTATGLVGNDTEDVITGFVYTYGGYEAGNNVGAYEMTIENANAENYTISIVPGKLIVEQAKIDLANATWGTQTEFVFSGEAIMPKLQNLPQGVEVNYTYLPANASSSIGSIGEGRPINVDVYKAQVSFVDETNYIYLNKPALEFTYNIVPLAIDFSNAEWTISDGAKLDYTGNAIQPTIKGYDIGYVTTYLETMYYCVALTDTSTAVDAIAPGVYRAYFEVQSLTEDFNLSIEGLESGKAWIEFEIVAQNLSDFAWNASNKISDGIVSNEGELNYDITLSHAQLGSEGYQVYLIGADLGYVDVEYTYNGLPQEGGSVFIVNGFSNQSVTATLTLKEEYQGANYILDITTVYLHITLTEQVFATLTLNGEAFAETDLKDGIRFEYGSVLAFTMIEGYQITDQNQNPITSITFDEDNQVERIIITVDNGEGFVKSYTFGQTYFIPKVSIAGTEYTYDHHEDIAINLGLQEDEIIIDFDEKYLDKYLIAIHYNTITNQTDELIINKVPYTLESAHLVDNFMIMCGKSIYSLTSIANVEVNQFNPFTGSVFTLQGFDAQATNTYQDVSLILSNQVITGITFEINETEYSNVKAFADLALTTEVNLLDINSYDSKLTYFAVYDNEDQLVGIVVKEIMHEFITSNEFAILPSVDSMVFSTNGSAVAEVVFTATAENVQVNATLNGETQLALTQAQTSNVAFRLEIVCGEGEDAKTYFSTGTWTIVKNVEARDRIETKGVVPNLNPNCEEEYRISGSVLNLTASKKYHIGNISEFGKELEYLWFVTLEGYTISARALVEIDNEYYIELAFIDSLQQDAGKCLIKLMYNGTYDNDTSITAKSVYVYDYSQTDLTITNDTITISDLSTYFLDVKTTNPYAAAYITNSQGEIVADNSYGVVMVEFREAGTYSLIVTATDGTLKTYSVVVQGEYVPVLEIVIGNDTFTMHVDMVTDEITGDFQYDEYFNYFLNVGADKVNDIISEKLAITSMRGTGLEEVRVQHYDDTEITKDEMANGFLVPVLYTNDEIPYFVIEIVSTYEDETYTNIIFCYLTDEDPISTEITITLTDGTVLEQKYNLITGEFSGDFIFCEVGEKYVYYAYIGQEYLSEVNNNAFTVAEIYYNAQGTYYDTYNPSKTITSFTNVDLTVNAFCAGFTIVYTIGENEYCDEVQLVFQDELSPLFAIEYGDLYLTEYMIPQQESAPVFSGDFELSMAQGQLTFVGYIGKIIGETPETITIPHAVCNQGSTFKDGFSGTAIEKPFKDVELTVDTYNETPSALIIVNEYIYIYLLLEDRQYSATLTFGDEVFDFSIVPYGSDFGDIEYYEGYGDVVLLYSDVSSVTLTLNKTFEDYSYYIIDDEESVIALQTCTKTFAQLEAEGKLFAPGEEIVLTFDNHGFANIWILAEGCTGTETGLYEIMNVVYSIGIYLMMQ